MTIEPVVTPDLVPFDGTFEVSSRSTVPPEGAPDRKACERRLEELRERLAELQRVLYADNRYAVLLVFQALDAAGKDGTIRAILRGVNPAGCQVFSFKQPSREELDHDFLWRTAKRLPERGRIGVFNRSYYEEVLVVRVHPSFLEAQRLPGTGHGPALWEERYEAMRDHERHLARSGTVVLKFWLNVSAEEQRRRFLARLDEPEKHWKFSVGDVRESEHRAAYLEAFEEALAATSRPWAPWYAIPADDKPYMRMRVAEIVVDRLERLPLRYPTVDGEAGARFDEMREILTRE
jgi:PPK2 family polyphosphate:nucleotide phosphotransferase